MEIFLATNFLNLENGYHYRCSLENLVLEMDRILRPDGWAIFRDEVEVLKKVQEMVTSLHWDVRVMYTMKGEELLAAQKRFWRPDASA